MIEPQLQKNDEFVVNGFGWYGQIGPTSKQRLEKKKRWSRKGGTYFRRGWNRIQSEDNNLYHFTYGNDWLKKEAGLVRGDDGSGMLIEKYQDGEFVEHLLAGVASGYDEDKSCTQRNEEG